MGQDKLARIGLLASTDAPAVSTILEEVFQYFDPGFRGDRRYKTIDRQVRLRLALDVFERSGYARLDTTVKPNGMVMPTAKLMSLLGLKDLTTDLQPVILQPIRQATSQAETTKHRRYVRAFQSAMANEFSDFLKIPLSMLAMGEQGILRQGRRADGSLAWFITKEELEIDRRQKALEARTLRQLRLVIKKGLELEFEISNEEILLIPEDQLPIPDALLDALDVTQMELFALFVDATKLLAATDPTEPMRAYAAQNADGIWQVKLLSA